MELTPFVVSGLMLCFLWSGFIRSGLGFGGLVLTLPFALMVVDSPLDIMPLAVVHAFVVGISTVFLRFRNVDWMQLIKMINVMAILRSHPIKLGTAAGIQPGGDDIQ